MGLVVVGGRLASCQVFQTGRHSNCATPSTPVILSEAPRRCVRHVVAWRVVEGSRRCLVQRNCVKAFSREFPDAASAVQTSSGSFDSSSPRKAGLGLAQDDTGTESHVNQRRYRRTDHSCEKSFMRQFRSGNVHHKGLQSLNCFPVSSTNTSSSVGRLRWTSSSCSPF